METHEQALKELKFSEQVDSNEMSNVGQGLKQGLVLAGLLDAVFELLEREGKAKSSCENLGEEEERGVGVEGQEGRLVEFEVECERGGGY